MNILVERQVLVDARVEQQELVAQQELVDVQVEQQVLVVPEGVLGLAAVVELQAFVEQVIPDKLDNNFGDSMDMKKDMIRKGSCQNYHSQSYHRKDRMDNHIHIDQKVSSHQQTETDEHDHYTKINKAN